MRKVFLFALLVLGLLTSCGPADRTFDASGSFEADEVVVSSQLAGQLLSFNVNEGDPLRAGQEVGTIDSTGLALQKQQVAASIRALGEKTANVQPQIRLLQNQLAV